MTHTKQLEQVMGEFDDSIYPRLNLRMNLQIDRREVRIVEEVKAFIAQAITDSIKAYEEAVSVGDMETRNQNQYGWNANNAERAKKVDDYYGRASCKKCDCKPESKITFYVDGDEVSSDCTNIDCNLYV